MLSQTITLRNTVYRSWTGHPIHYGVPWPEGAVTDANSLCAVHLSDGSDVSDSLDLSDRLGSRQKPQFKLARATPVRRVVLNVTHACNLACVYCFAGGNQPGPAMTADVARKALGLLDPRAQVDVAFFGGEPLLAWDMIRRVMDEAQVLAAKRKSAAKFHITTNGLLLDEEKVRFLSARPCSLLVSLDGPEAIHNAARPARSPKTNSFRSTMQAIECARGSVLGRRLMARATFDTSGPQLVPIQAQ